VYFARCCKFPDSVKTRSLTDYDQLLNHQTPRSAFDASTFGEISSLLKPGLRSTVVDFGCGAGRALLSLSFQAALSRKRLFGIGIDKHICPELFSKNRPAKYNSSVRFIEYDLDSKKWPVSEESIGLAFSNKAAMFIGDKLKFLERVWSSLAIGGIGVIELDVSVIGSGEKTPRIVLPCPIESLIQRQVLGGKDIFVWFTSCPLSPEAVAQLPGARTDGGRLARFSCVVALRRNTVSKLDFGMRLIATMPFERSIIVESWGLQSHYVASNHCES
jgi:SAM-dependent methyltransferase